MHSLNPRTSTLSYAVLHHARGRFTAQRHLRDMKGRRRGVSRLLRRKVRGFSQGLTNEAKKSAQENTATPFKRRGKNGQSQVYIAANMNGTNEVEVMAKGLWSLALWCTHVAVLPRVMPSWKMCWTGGRHVDGCSSGRCSRYEMRASFFGKLERRCQGTAITTSFGYAPWHEDHHSRSWRLLCTVCSSQSIGA
jgi:hypothetical protein